MLKETFRMTKNILIGMKTVGYHFFRKPITECFPEKKPDLPKRFRGKVAFVLDENNKIKCIGCKTCVGVCPSEAISIETEKDTLNKHNIVKSFKIDMGKCILCGNCEYFCPQNAIKLTKEIELAVCDKNELEINMDKLYKSQLKAEEKLRRKKSNGK